MSYLQNTKKNYSYQKYNQRNSQKSSRSRFCRQRSRFVRKDQVVVETAIAPVEPQNSKKDSNVQMNRKEVIESMSIYIINCIHKNDRKNTKALTPSLFDSPNTPTIPTLATIRKLLTTIVTRRRLAAESVVLALVLLERTHIKITSRNWERMVMISLLLANKEAEDVYSVWNVRFVGFIPGLQVYEINYLEMEFLQYIKYRLHVEQHHYLEYYTLLFQILPERIPEDIEIEPLVVEKVEVEVDEVIEEEIEIEEEEEEEDPEELPQVDEIEDYEEEQVDDEVQEDPEELPQVDEIEDDEEEQVDENVEDEESKEEEDEDIQTVEEFEENQEFDEAENAEDADDNDQQNEEYDAEVNEEEEEDDEEEQHEDEEQLEEEEQLEAEEQSDGEVEDEDEVSEEFAEYREECEEYDYEGGYCSWTLKNAFPIAVGQCAKAI